MKNVFIFSNIFLLFLVFMSSCTQEGIKSENKGTEVIAKVGDISIYKEDLQGRDVKLDDYIDEEVLYQQGLRNGVDKEPELVRRVQDFERFQIVANVKSQIINEYFKEHPITDDVVNDYFEKNKKRFYKLLVTKIASRDGELIEKIRQQMLNGDSIDKVKGEYTESLLVIPLKSHTKDFNHLFPNVFQVGEISDIEESGGDYYFVVIREIKEPKSEVLKTVLFRRLEAEQSIKAINEYLDSAKIDYNIEIQSGQ